MNYLEFLKWKNTEEMQEVVQYRLLRYHKTKNGMKKTFVCNRVGHLQMKIERRRMPRRKGVCRIGAKCPAQILAWFSNQGVQVEYLATHWYHKKELKHISIKPDDRKKIYDQLELGVSVRNVVDNMRKSYSQQLKRIHIIDRQDVYNVAHQLKLINRFRLHNDDSTSVALWVKENENKPETPILYFKNKGTSDPVLKGDEFMLVLSTPMQKNILKKYGNNKICIDTTFNTNAYGFLLTTIMVTNEYEEGVPVAFCISSCVTQTIMKIFFGVIKKSIGILKPQIFMSDDDKTYYESWKEEMGEAGKRLLCIWHVVRCWKKNVIKIRNKELREDTLKQLRILQQESDHDNFSIMLTNFLHNMDVDPRLADFKNYFINYYASRVEMWAQYNRMSSEINTNMFLESFHRHLKYIYLHGRRNKRLDTLIQALLKHVSDKVMEKNITDIRQKGTYRLHEIHQAHKRGKEITKENILWDSNCKNWKVNSYIVKQISNACNKCKLQCTVCKVCRHMFTCECYYYGHKIGLCKHIHAVCMHFKLEEKNIQVQEDIDFSTNELKAALGNNVYSNKMVEINEMAVALEKLSTEPYEKICTDSELETCRQYLKKAMQILMKTNDDNSNKLTFRIPHNKKVEHQNRWKCVKRKLEVDYSSKILESNTIKKQLMSPVVNISIHHDHCYTRNQFAVKKNEEQLNETSVSKQDFIRNHSNRFTVKELNKKKLEKVIVERPQRILEYHLRSLETQLCEEEVNQIKRLSSDFIPGYIYDCVINEYLRRLCHSANRGYPVDTVYTQCILLNRLDNVINEVINILKSDIAFIPSNPTTVHWILLVVMPTKKLILVLDPLNKEGRYKQVDKNADDNTSKYLELWRKAFSFKSKSKDWIVSYGNCRQQEDGNSCGAFVCWYVNQILQSKSVEDYVDIYKYRKNIYMTLRNE